MEINKLEEVIKLIKSSSDEEGVGIIRKYADKRCEGAIERAWNRARVIQRFSVKNKKEQLKKHILEIDKDAGAISTIEFLRYFSALQDFIKEGVEMYDTPEITDFSDELEGMMYSKLQNIKLDRRTLFAKES